MCWLPLIYAHLQLIASKRPPRAARTHTTLVWRFNFIFPLITFALHLNIKMYNEAEGAEGRPVQSYKLIASIHAWRLALRQTNVQTQKSVCICVICGEKQRS